jgi:hypothetical protein
MEVTTTHESKTYFVLTAMYLHYVCSLIMYNAEMEAMSYFQVGATKSSALINVLLLCI